MKTLVIAALAALLFCPVPSETQAQSRSRGRAVSGVGLRGVRVSRNVQRVRSFDFNRGRVFRQRNVAGRVIASALFDRGRNFYRQRDFGLGFSDFRYQQSFRQRAIYRERIILAPRAIYVESTPLLAVRRPYAQLAAPACPCDEEPLEALPPMSYAEDAGCASGIYQGQGLYRSRSRVRQ